MTMLQASPREIALASAAGCALLLAAANYLASHARPLPRLGYSALVVFGAGTLIPAFALKAIASAGMIAGAPLDPAPVTLAAVTALSLAWSAVALRREPAYRLRGAPGLLIGVIGPSLAEAVVFLGLVFNIALFALQPAFGHAAAAAAATLVTSAVFSLYHLTHRPPWNSWRVVRVLFVVWLAVGACYAVTGNLWAAAILNTCFAMVGFVKNGVTLPPRPLASLGLAAAGIASVALIGSSLR